MHREYPRVELNMTRLRRNMERVISRCRAQGVAVCGVIKGCNGIPAVARAFLDCGAAQIGTSRLEQILRCREAGINAPCLLLRIPGLTELPDTVRYADLSLQSERSVLNALEAECARQGKTHSVIVMADLGDLREGFWDKEELLTTCCHVEADLPHVHLAGVGVNLGCYGSVRPTVEKMEQLLAAARQVEACIGRRLEIVSGGATSSYPLIHEGTMPAGVNHLRLGEGILLGAKDLQTGWGYPGLDYLDMETFTLRAEVLEVKEKPSYPQGELAIDAFGNRPVYVDVGMQIRALLDFGRADVGPVEALVCREPGMAVIGASSDHCIVDVTRCRRLCPGDIVEFGFSYANMLYATDRSDMPLGLYEE